MLLCGLDVRGALATRGLEVDARTLRGLAGGVPKDSARHHRELALATLFVDLRPRRVDFARGGFGQGREFYEFTGQPQVVALGEFSCARAERRGAARQRGQLPGQ